MHLVGYFCMNCTMMHGSMNIKQITFCPRAFSVSLTVFEIIKQKTVNIQAATFGPHTNAYTNCQKYFD